MIKNVEFKDVIDFLEGPGIRKWQFKDHGIKLINIRNLVNDKLDLSNTENHLDELEVEQKYSHFLLEEGDYVMASSGATWGKIAEVKEKHLPLCLNTSIIKLKPKNKEVEKRYLWHFIKSSKFTRQIDRLITGSAQPNFGPSHLMKINFPLPPLPQQKKIAAILDAADTYRQKTKALIAKYDELTQSLFLDMFGDPVTNPKGWKKKLLGNVLTFLTSGSRGWAKYYSPAGDIFLRIQNVGYDRLKMDDITYVKAPDSAESIRTQVQSGDIILSITADLGRTAVIPKQFPKAHINQHLAILRLYEKYNPRYISAYIATKGGQLMFNKLDKGGVKAGLNFADIKSYPVLLPPLTLQNQFTERVQAIEAQKAQAQASLAKAEDLFNSLLQRAFKGELAQSSLEGGARRAEGER